MSHDEAERSKFTRVVAAISSPAVRKGFNRFEHSVFLVRLHSELLVNRRGELDFFARDSIPATHGPRLETVPERES